MLFPLIILYKKRTDKLLLIQYNHSKMNLPGGKAGGGEGLWRLSLILGVLFFGLAYTVLVTGLGSVQSGETDRKSVV